MKHQTPLQQSIINYTLISKCRPTINDIDIQLLIAFISYERNSLAFTMARVSSAYLKRFIPLPLLQMLYQPTVLKSLTDNGIMIIALSY